jgi:hypothetical protein
MSSFFEDGALADVIHVKDDTSRHATIGSMVALDGTCSSLGEQEMQPFVLTLKPHACSSSSASNGWVGRLVDKIVYLGAVCDMTTSYLRTDEQCSRHRDVPALEYIPDVVCGVIERVEAHLYVAYCKPENYVAPEHQRFCRSTLTLLSDWLPYVVACTTGTLPSGL